MSINRYVFLISILLVASFLIAYWYFNKIVDDKIVTIQKAATIQNEFGFSFTIFRHPNEGNVWVRFSLPESSSEKLDKNNPPIIWIGGSPPRHMATSKEFQESIDAIGGDFDVYEWRPKQVAVVVWHGIIKEGFSQDIIDLLQGDKIKVRYFLNSGAVNETFFSLNGRAESIAQALDISQTIDNVAQQKAENFRKAYSAALGKCKIGTKESDSCFSKLKSCRENSGMDVDKLNACVKL